MAALNLFTPRAGLRIDGDEVAVHAAFDADTDSHSDGDAAPGTVLATHVDGWTVQTATRALRIVAA